MVASFALGAAKPKPVLGDGNDGGAANAREWSTVDGARGRGRDAPENAYCSDTAASLPDDGCAKPIGADTEGAGARECPERLAGEPDDADKGTAAVGFRSSTSPTLRPPLLLRLLGLLKLLKLLARLRPPLALDPSKLDGVNAAEDACSCPLLELAPD